MKNKNHADKLAVIANQKTVEKEYWLGQLSNLTEKSNFPFDFTKENITSDQVETAKSTLQGEIFSQLTQLSKNSNIKLNMILAAGLMVLLKKYTCMNDITIGTPIYKQESDTDFINTVLVLRNRLEDAVTFKELLLQVRDVINNAVQNQNYPIDYLAGHLNIPCRENENPFFDTGILLRNIHYKKYIDDLHYHMLFDFNRTECCLEMEVEYNLSLYRGRTVAQIIRHYTRLLETVLSNVEITLACIDILSVEEKEQLLIEFNGREEEYPCDKTFHRLFEEQLDRTPDCIAVFGPAFSVKPVGPASLSYRELNEHSNRLAYLLIKKGVQADTIVGIKVDRSVEMIVGVMGILKAGCAYLPIDLGYPEERIVYMWTDSRAKLMVTASTLANLPSYPLTFLPSYLQNPSNLAYLIYTSGSTGKPKGVMVQHSHLVNVAMGWRQEYKLLKMEVTLLQMANFCFDVFAGDLARVFLNGGKMIINPVLGADPESLYQLITSHRVTLFESTPSYVIPFMNYVYNNNLKIDSLQLLILGSDTCSSQDFKALVARFGKQLRIVNSYGVTEATIDSSYYEPLAGDELPSSGSVPIGKPLPNVMFYILDFAGGLLPLGVPGELCIGGASVTRGYLNKPELTAEKFINKSFFRGSRGAVFSKKAPLVYRTGDLARRLPDGNVEFLGRMDYQVKVRGYRIELGEIENSLLEHEDIKEAIVMEKGEASSDKYLCGYIISDKTIGPEALRRFLGKRLPDYMIPWFYVQMDRFPLTPNGKVDRNALPEPETMQEIAYAAPRDEMETELVLMWADVLSVEKEKIGIDTRFFDLGGNSLKAIVLIARIHKAFNVKLLLEDIFRIQTIRGTAQHMQEADKARYLSIEKAEEKEYYILSSAQKRLYTYQQLNSESSAYNMPILASLEGFLDKEKFAETFKKLIYRHESLMTSFHFIDNGPVQKIHNDVEFKIEYSDVGIPPGDIMKKFVHSFDLSRTPLLRVGLFKTDETRHFLAVDMHHIISDAISHMILIRDFLLFYKGDSLEPLKVQYKDYSEWEYSEKEKERRKKQEIYWLEQFSNRQPVLEPPADYTRSERQGSEGRSVNFDIEEEESRRLKEQAKQESATLQMIMTAIFHILLSKIGYRGDIATGTTISGRRHADLEGIIGLFINTLPLRSSPSGEKTFRQFLKEIREISLKAYENQDYSYESLINKVASSKDSGRNPIFDIMFEIQGEEAATGDISNQQIPSLKFTLHEMEINTTKFDQDWLGVETAKGISFSVSYSTQLYKPETIELMMEKYLILIKHVIDDPQSKIKDLDCHTIYEEELKKVQKVDFNF
ncbi:MAG: amino acid adenylation domain-containing protein [Candidatus Aminicenantes bacterium]|nr:amino acid adenylation domain-containing protein [Candidatus Aminicenantes bacterium]